MSLQRNTDTSSKTHVSRPSLSASDRARDDARAEEFRPTLLSIGLALLIALAFFGWVWLDLNEFRLGNIRIPSLSALIWTWTAGILFFLAAALASSGLSIIAAIGYLRKRHGKDSFVVTGQKWRPVILVVISIVLLVAGVVASIYIDSRAASIEAGATSQIDRELIRLIVTLGVTWSVLAFGGAFISVFMVSAKMFREFLSSFENQRLSPHNPSSLIH